MTKVALVQLTSTDNLEENFKKCADFIKAAAEQGAEFVCLPENFAHMPTHSNENFAVAEPASGHLLGRYRQLAKDHNVWLSLGGFKTPTKPPSNKLNNAHFIVDKFGTLKATYDKLHLFKIQSDRSTHDEGTTTQAGTKLMVCDSPVGKLGLSICYDLRFPEMYIKMAQAGAQVQLVPAAFFSETGEAHWEVLLRALAVTTQSFVVAAAQVGRHNPRRESYGNSMVVDPWGKIIARIDRGEGIMVADVDLKLVDDSRKRLTALEHRNCDGAIVKS